MFVGNGRKLEWLVGLALGLFVLWYFCLDSRAEPQVVKENEQGGKVETTKLTKLYFGTKACSGTGCHSKPDPEWKAKDLKICRCDEFAIWEKLDKHKDAVRVLLARVGKNGEKTETLGSHICKLMGIANVLEDKRCMNCHGVLVTDKKQLDGTFDVVDGVSCVACHGPYEEWVIAHNQRTQKKIDFWRGLSRAEKEKAYGLTDLWNPVSRTKVCSSCHIGNAAEGKVVTHEMYAAGHPPLPNLEIATFSDGMPRHWEYLAEKNPEKLKLVKEYNNYNTALQERTELLVICGLVSFRDTMQLLANQAHPEPPAKTDWPEFAQFDCYACHHDLKTDSWRQQRGYVGKPGRPVLRRWPTALVPLAIHHIAQKDKDKAVKLTAEFVGKLNSLTAAFKTHPFGEPKKVATAAVEAAKWADDLLPLLRQQPFNRAAAEKLLSLLGMLYEKDLLDFDSARQVTWAYKVLADDVFGDGFSAKKTSWTKDKQASQLYLALNKQLQLNLIQGQANIAENFLPGYLNSINNYDPEVFRNSFGAFTKFLKALPK